MAIHCENRTCSQVVIHFKNFYIVFIFFRTEDGMRVMEIEEQFSHPGKMSGVAEAKAQPDSDR